MAQILVVLFVLGVVLVVVTVVGHGIWLFFELTIKSLVRSPTASKARCSACGHPDGMVEDRCVYCGHVPVDRLDPRDEILATARQLRRMHVRGDVTERQFSELISSLRWEYESRVGEPRGAAAILLSAGALPGDAGEVSGGMAAAPAAPSVDEVPQSAEGALARSAEVLDAEVLDAEVIEDEEPVRLGRVDAEASREATAAAAAVHPLEQPEPDEAPPAPRRARRALADVLQAFMEESNIRWIELVSGLLIVGCAIGLVVSLHEMLAEVSKSVPYFPALLLMAGTAAVHGAGQYTMSKWNLRATSQGLLVIAILLVPLSVVASIVLSGSGAERVPLTSPMYWIAVTVGLASFGAMTFFSARALAQPIARPVTLAVMGTSIGQLIINRAADPGLEASLLLASALVLLPVSSAVMAMFAQLRAAHRDPAMPPEQANRLLIVGGIAIYSLLVPLVLLATRAQAPADLLAMLCPALSVVAASVLVCGLVLHRHVDPREHAVLRMTGTSVAVLAGMLVGVFLVLAWPRPELLIAVGAIDAAVLLALAIRCNLAMLHGAAVGALAMSLLVTFHVVTGTSGVAAGQSGRALVEAFLMGRSSLVLGLVGLAAAAVGVWTSRSSRPEVARVYTISAMCFFIASVAVANYAAFAHAISDRLATADEPVATWLLAVYAVVALGAGVRMRHRDVSLAGSVLLLLALVAGLACDSWTRGLLSGVGLLPERPVLVALLAHGLAVSVMAIVAGAWRRTDKDDVDGERASIARSVFEPLCGSALAASVLTLPSVLAVRESAFDTHAIYAALMCFPWLVAARLLRVRVLMDAFQTGLSLCIGLAVAAGVERTLAWGDFRLLDPRHAYVQLAALAATCGLWSLVRQGSAALSTTWHKLLNPGRPGADQILLGIAVVAGWMAALAGGWPPAARELGIATADTWLSVHWSGPWAWLGLGAVTGTVLIEWRAGTRPMVVAHLALAAATAALLAAGPFSESVAVASAIRWLFAGYLLAAALVNAFRDSGARALERLGIAGRFGRDAVQPLRALVLVLAGLPVVGLTVVAAVRFVSGASLGGPVAESLFGRLSGGALYATPLAITVLAFVMFAVRDRLPGMMLAASAVLQGAIALAVVVPVAGTSAAGEIPVRLVQSMACGLGAFSLAWLVLWRFGAWPGDQDHDQEQDTGLRRGAGVMGAHALSAILAVLALSLWAALDIALSPVRLSPAREQLGSWFGYATAVLGAAVFVWHAGAARTTWIRGLRVELGIYGFVLAVGPLVAASTDALDTPRDWLAYHGLTVSLLATCILASASGVVRRLAAQSSPAPSLSPTGVTVALSTALGTSALVFLGMSGDPMHPTWTVAILAVISAAGAGLAMELRSQTLAYASSALVAFASALAVIHWRPLAWEFDHMVCAIAACVTLSAIGWLAVEMWYQRRAGEAMAPSTHWPAIHRVAGFAGAVLVWLVAVAAILGARDVDSWIEWTLAGLVGCLLAGTLWDRGARQTMAGLYGWGMAAAWMGFVQVAGHENLERDAIWVGCAAVLAGYLALAGHLWHWGVNLSKWGLRLGIPQPVRGLEGLSTWMPAVNLALGGLLAVFSIAGVLVLDERWMRVLCGFLPVGVAYASACVAQPPRVRLGQVAALMLLALSAAALGWADLDPRGGGAAWLVRTIRLLVAFSIAAFGYGGVVGRSIKSSHRWFESVRIAAAFSVVAAIGSLGAALSLEFILFVPEVGVSISTFHVGVVAATLVLLAAALVSMATLPGTDPMNLGETGRMAYVYTAQLVIALLVAHLYLARPALFNTTLRPYWPYIIMAIAMTGVGVGEMFLRLGWRVLGKPLHRTGGLFPLIPVIGMWVVDSSANHAAVFFVAGMLYVVVAILRRSLVSAIAAAIAGNAGIWVLLHDSELSLMAHPQFWAIPPAISVLIGAQLNRHRLSDAQLSAIRYATIAVVYVSSSAEVFLRGIGDAFWPPIVLLSLSVAGVLVGIMLQVRAFLYLGTSFLGLSIVSMVWHAAHSVEHPWPWWAFGIGLGASILVAYGFFEKNRQEVLVLIERLRRWER